MKDQAWLKSANSNVLVMALLPSTYVASLHTSTTLRRLFPLLTTLIPPFQLTIVQGNGVPWESLFTEAPISSDDSAVTFRASDFKRNDCFAYRVDRALYDLDAILAKVTIFGGCQQLQ